MFLTFQLYSTCNGGTVYTIIKKEIRMAYTTVLTLSEGQTLSMVGIKSKALMLIILSTITLINNF